MVKMFASAGKHEAIHLTDIPPNPQELQPITATSGQLRERLIWALLQGIGESPSLDLSLFPLREMKDLLASGKAKLSPLLAEVFDLTTSRTEAVDAQAEVTFPSIH